MQTVQQERLPLALIKPNRHELQELAARPLLDTAALLHEARRLNGLGIEAVAISLGADGALLCTATGAWQAAPLPVQPLSTVGAGDAQVAGLLAARYVGQLWSEALRLGVAFATAKLGRIGPHLPAPAQGYIDINDIYWWDKTRYVYLVFGRFWIRNNDNYKYFSHNTYC